MPMAKKIQAKDIDEAVILNWLRRRPGVWHTHASPLQLAGRDPEDPWYLMNAFPNQGADIPEKVLLAKLRSMGRRGLIEGCGCGCRGDWHVPENPLIALALQEMRKQTGNISLELDHVEYHDDGSVSVYISGTAPRVESITVSFVVD